MNRVKRLSLLVLVCFLALLANLVRMQVVQGEYYRVRSERNRIRIIYLESARGKIADRYGRSLADNRLSFNCSAIYREAKSGIKKSCALLAPVLGENAETLEQRFYGGKPGAFQTVSIAENIGVQKAVAVEERLDMLPGFMIETRPQREYPYGAASAHLVGYIGPMAGEEDDAIEFYGYSYSDWVGQEGVEKSYESYLRGFSGGLQIEVDSRGRMVRALGVREPQPGKDIELTVDARLQNYLLGNLESKRGAVIVMELGEGGLLAIASSPSFDPNLFASKKGRKQVQEYLHGQGSPMVNRGIRGQYPPGSIFKIVTALAGLEKGKITPDTKINCEGKWAIGDRYFPCWKSEGHGPQVLAEGFAHSCNVYFYNVGVMAGLEAIFQKSVELGFNQRTGIDLPSERKGFVPSREWKRKKLHEAWYEGETANLAIGQGYLQVTPLQALVMVAAVATNGHIFKPHVIDKIDGVRVAEEKTKNIVYPAKGWSAVRKGLEEVVASPTGTGRLARVPGLQVAGKTGTAQSGQDKTHAWFVGYAPADNPKVALVVFLENGGRGGIAAAGLASSVFQWLSENSYL